METSKERRINYQFRSFALACFSTFLGLFVYVLCWKKIPFPSQWLSRNLNQKYVQPRLFFSGIGIHLQVNFALGILFMFLKTEKIDSFRLKKWRFWITRILVIISSLIYGYWILWSKNRMNLNKVLFLGLLILVVNCFLLELLINLMNQYGICDAFNLLFFTEFLPLFQLQECWNQQRFFHLLGLFFFTSFFIWIINLKWKAPVKTNSFYILNNKISKKDTNLEFRINFSFINLIYLSQFISFFYTIFLIKNNQSVNWKSFESLKECWEQANFQKRILSEIEITGGGIWSSIFQLNEKKWIFQKENFTRWWEGKNFKTFIALLILIFLRWASTWIQIYKNQLKAEEISKDLKERGIYINRVPSSAPTKKLLKKIVNKMIFFWNFLILIFNIIFDNIFKFLFGFQSWFSAINSGTELVRQIKTKYFYIKQKV